MGDYSTILHNKQKHLGDSCCCSVIVGLWLFGLPLIPPSNHPEGTLLFFGWSLGFPLFSCTHLPVLRFLNFSIKGPALPSILCQIVCLQQVANTLFLSSFLAFLFSRASVCSQCSSHQLNSFPSPLSSIRWASWFIHSTHLDHSALLFHLPAHPPTATLTWTQPAHCPFLFGKPPSSPRPGGGPCAIPMAPQYLPQCFHMYRK